MKRRIVSPLVAAMLAAALLTPEASHAVMDDLVKQALALAESGKGKEAFDMLAPKEAERAGDPDFDTVLGIAANQAGDFPRAVFALERVLSVQPENTRARAELGRALFAVGDSKGAKTLLEQTKQAGIPVEAAKTIDQFLKAIERVEEAGQNSYKGYVEFGIGNDTNANSGPAVTSVAVPAFAGLVLALNPTGVKKDSNFYTFGGGMSGRYVIDSRWSLIGNFSGNIRANSASGADVFDTQQIDVNAGAAYRVERDDYSLVAQVSDNSVDHRVARRGVGAVGEWTHRFDGFRQITSYAQYTRLTYPGQNLRDADRYVLGGSYAHLFSTGLLAFAGAYVGEEAERNSGVPHLGHKFYGVRGGLQKPLMPNLAAFGTVGYERRNFGGTDPLFLVTRHDDQYNVNIGLSWSPYASWRVTPQVSWTRSSSNVIVNDYEKRVMSVTARREF